MTNAKMKSKIFKSSEIISILSKEKTMFREVIKPQPNNYDGRTAIALSVDDNGQLLWQDDDSGWFKDYDDVRCPYQVGQKIFCKESFSSYYEDDGLVRGDIFLYRADEDSKDLDDVHWKPAQHMKQEHSRLTPLIKEIKVERLGEVSEEDCLKEGIRGFYSEDLKARVVEDWKSRPESYLRKWGFKELWNATHKKPEEKFEANPWVWCVTVEVVK